ncbi:hypothetical protein PoB_002248800 [Plakobranchus ocellatus]|uniref:Uncharacterized protein n=1 Tax=Plakobranchus ocellatus TaxID=259542 RepID=A0AAV3ZN16_9GAST|nr:hypothetical protein PoB_002248800 [Plakobranchus ocellatus]
MPASSYHTSPPVYFDVWSSLRYPIIPWFCFSPYNFLIPLINLPSSPSASPSAYSKDEQFSNLTDTLLESGIFLRPTAMTG